MERTHHRTERRDVKMLSSDTKEHVVTGFEKTINDLTAERDALKKENEQLRARITWLEEALKEGKG